MPDQHHFEVVIPNETSEGQAVQARIIELLEMFAYPTRDVFGVRLAMEEALVNAIKHGNQMDPSKTIRMECLVSATVVRITIEDQGNGFDPSSIPDPTEDENLDMPGGRGVMLIHSFMDSVTYNERGNQITMEKARAQEEPADAE